jgi:hypothetical protein
MAYYNNIIMDRFKKFKKILNEYDLKNIDFVKEYLKFSFYKKRPKKNNKLYINICKIYDSYPGTVKELLDNIPTLGYYKDYFYIYNYSKNDDLNEYILNLVIKQLNQDLDNLKQNKEISTIAKYFPRENSKLNKNNSFIAAFCERYYPGLQIYSARKKYRKLKSMLNEKLGTLESLICTKQLDKINLNKVSPMALENKKELLLVNDEMRAKLDQHETDQLKKLSLASFIKELLLDKHSIEKMQNLWEHNRYCMEIPFIYRLISNSVCVIDLSKDTFSTNGQYFALGIALLIDQFSLVKNKTIVCKDNLIQLKGNILERAKQLWTYSGPCKELDAKRYYDLINVNNTDENIKNFIFVSTKELMNHESLCDKKITMIHYIPYGDHYNIRYFNGSKIKEFRRYSNKNTIFSKEAEYYETRKDINNIIIESNELNDRNTPVVIVLFFFMMWMIVKYYENFYTDSVMIL